VNLSHFLSQEVGKAFITNQGAIKNIIKRTCINVTELDSKIMSHVSTGDVSGILIAVSESVESGTYEEVIDFKKHEEVWSGKTPDQVYEWSLKKLVQIPIESKAITPVGNVLAMRNGFTKET